jgi:fumarate reductase subunit D
MIRPARAHPLRLAWLAHRLSGLALALFLPFHFFTLSLALTSPEALDGVLRWADAPPVKLAEGGLVFLLAIHLFGGLRLMALELLGWTARQKTAAAAAAAGAAFVAGLFLLQAV